MDQMKKPKYRIAKMFWFASAKECEQIEKVLKRLGENKSKATTK